MILNLLKHYLQRNILEVEENTEVKFPYSSFHVKKLVTLLLGAQTKIAIMRRRVTGTKAKMIPKVTNHTRT